MKAEENGRAWSHGAQRSILVAAVLLDLLAVSLVVPLLPARFRELGISQKSYGLISSTYSVAQICGGLILGALSDRGLGRRGLLLLNFVGAGVSYAIVGVPRQTLVMLVFSRVLVGLCKQTMTASTALMTELTEPGSDRVKWIGRISSAAQISWIAGQSVGGMLNSWGDPRYPAVAAVALYAIDFALVRSTISGGCSDAPVAVKKGEKPTVGSRLRRLVASREVAEVVIVRLSVAFVQRATGGARTLYELDRWNLSRSEYAYFSSFKSLVGVVASWQCAGALSRSFGVTSLLRLGTATGLIGALVEAVPSEFWRSAIGLTVCPTWLADSPFLAKAICTDPSLLVYGAVVFPATAAATQVMAISLRSRFTEVVPRSETGSALASLDVLMSAVGVAAPLAGGFLFDGLAADKQPLVSAAMHLAALIVVLGCSRRAVDNAVERGKSDSKTGESKSA